MKYSLINHRLSKYLTVDENGQFQLKQQKGLRIIDFHIHLAQALPGGGGSSRKAGSPGYPTLPPRDKMNLSIPYWTDSSYLDEKYSGMGGLVRFSKEGLRIFKDMQRSGTLENCLENQRQNQIIKSVVLPISTVKSDQSMFALEESKRSPNHLIPFCSVHPGDPEMERKLPAYIERGAKGVKLKMMDSEVLKHGDNLNRLLHICADFDIPVLFHTGAVFTSAKKSRIMTKLLNSTRVEIFEPILNRAPKNLKFIFGHSGIQQYELTAKLMDRFPSSMAELSCQSVESIEELIHLVGSSRLLYGSDWPALPSALTLAAILSATESSDMNRENILIKNASKLLSL